MKKLLFILVVFVVSACCNSPVEKLVYIPVHDTIEDKSNIARIIELEYRLQLTQDSLNAVKDSIGDDLFEARYKLERIREYNKIAAKGNNIKYLRGWINRVLEN